MPNSPERRALALAASILCLGVAARVVQGGRSVPAATDAEVQALDRQLARVDSARSARRPAARAPRGTGGARASAPGSRGRGPEVALPVDPDVADSAALERLPGIGPALASRIVASRRHCGPFGSLEGLQRVRGVGPATVGRLAPHVTFSGGSRPLEAAGAPGCTPSAARAAIPRRGRP